MHPKKTNPKVGVTQNAVIEFRIVFTRNYSIYELANISVPWDRVCESTCMRDDDASKLMTCIG